MVIKNCTVVFGCRILALFIFCWLSDGIAVLRQVFRWPEVERLVLEQVFAVLFDTAELGSVRIASVIVDYLVQFLLQLQTRLIHLLNTCDLAWFISAEVAVNIDIAIAHVFFLEW
jgi:hypothetical protein